MASSSDIREWLREQHPDRSFAANGRLKRADIDEYEAAHATASDADDDVSYPGEDGGPVSDSEPSAEQAPRTARKSARSAASGWLRGARGQKKASGPKRKFPRVPVTQLIEHTYSEMAWAAQGIPPLSRLLEAQAPVAGVVFEDVVRDTAIDKLLQPAARLEAQLDATYGMLAPPLYVLACLQTAPAPGAEPVLAHKAALAGLRHSLLVMSRVGGSSLERVIERGKANQERAEDVEKFMRYIFGIPEPDAQPAQPPADGQVLYSATLGAAAPA